MSSLILCLSMTGTWLPDPESVVDEENSVSVVGCWSPLPGHDLSWTRAGLVTYNKIIFCLQSQKALQVSETRELQEGTKENTRSLIFPPNASMIFLWPKSKKIKISDHTWARADFSSLFSSLSCRITFSSRSGSSPPLPSSPVIQVT